MKCILCPRACGIDRARRAGPCSATEDMRVAAVVIHRGEEPPLVTGAGSGAVFFAGCPLRCAYCQNRQISHTDCGYTLTPARLADYLLELERQGCANINLITPTHYARPLAETLSRARAGGLSIPVMLNSSGYESIATLEKLSPHMQLYLMDIKYGDNETGRHLSAVADYWDRTREAVAWLWEKVGALRTDADGHAVGGLIIRHLVLPGMLSNPFAVLEFIAELSPSIPVSLMAQYHPGAYAGPLVELRRQVRAEEYAVVLERAQDLGFETIFAQDADAPTTYLPDFTAECPFGEGPNLLRTEAFPGSPGRILHKKCD